MLPLGKTTKRCDGSFCFRALRGQNALRARTANPIELRGIRQRGFMRLLSQRSDDRRLSALMTALRRHDILFLPVLQDCQAHSQ